MAQLVVAAAGAAIGAGIGGSFLGLSAAAWGWQAGSLLGSFLVKKPEVQGPRLGDLRVAGTEYGQPIPWVAGSPRIAGQVIWASRIREIANTQKQGKGGGGQKVTTYTYEVDLLIRLTENRVASVSRIWSNGELVYGTNLTKAGVWASIAVYTGDEDQMPDPIYEAAVGSANAPAYRGGCTVRIQSLQLGQSKQIPNLTFEVNQPIAFDPFFDDVILLLHADGDLPPKDSSQNNWTGSLVNNANYENGRFSSGFGFLRNGVDRPSGPYVRINTSFPSGVIFSLNSDFTIEFWIFLDSSGHGATTKRIINQGGSTGNNFLINLENNTRRISVGNNSVSWIPRSEATTLPLKQWSFVAICRESGIIKLYIDGEFKAQSSTVNGGIGVNANIFLGGNPSVNADGTSIDGIIDEVRFTRNVARYTGNFTVPSDPFPDLQGTDSYFSDGISIDVAGAVGLLMNRAGYSQDDYDQNQISDQNRLVKGFYIGQISNTRSALEIFQKGWFFEASKSDKIYIRPRALTPIVTIPWEDLGTGEGMDNNSEPLALQLGNDLEVPAQLALSYNNIESDYNVATEYSDRLISEQQSVTTVQMPLGMTSAEAKGVVDAMLFDQVAGLTTTTIRVPLKYAFVEPGDVINVINFDGREYRLRVITKRDTLSIMELECVLDDVGALTSAGITDNGYITVTDPTRVAPTLFEAMDIPILRDADNAPGYYAAVAADRDSEDDEWDGAVYVQAFSTNAYEQEFITGESCIMGECLTTLGNWTGGNVFDETNTLNVEVVGELTSSTISAMLDDLTINAMKVGSELIRFRFATLLSNDGAKNTYRLSSLLRGQRGTEWAIDSHTSGETCVLLNNSVRRVGSTLTQIGQQRDVKGVTLNTLLSDVSDVQFTDTGVALKPFSPANVVALADGADLKVTWQRRTRLEVRYGGPVDQFVPLGEAFERYQIDIYNGSTLVRSDTVDNITEYVYTSADIATDGFTTGDPVNFEVSQLSAIVGQGYITEAQGIAP